MERVQRVEIIPNQLFWVCGSKSPTASEDTVAFSTDDEFTYESYVSDFGPLNIA
jgi:hypothetical protein